MGIYWRLGTLEAIKRCHARSKLEMTHLQVAIVWLCKESISYSRSVAIDWLDRELIGQGQLLPINWDMGNRFVLSFHEKLGFQKLKHIGFTYKVRTYTTLTYIYIYI